MKPYYRSITYFAALVCSLLALPFVSMATPEIYVTNATEFLNAIGSNRTVVLKQGDYDLSPLVGKSGAHYDFYRHASGRELHLFDLVGLTIKGEHGALPHLWTQPNYGEVLAFERCKDIRIEQVRAGHGLEKGECPGGVFSFEGCEDVVVRGCTLYGSGNRGFNLMNCKRFLSIQNVIEECTADILEIRDSEHIFFKACNFRNNAVMSQVGVWSSKEITFKDCIFKNNGEWVTAMEILYFFHLDPESAVDVSGGEFIGNICDYMGPSPEQVRIKGLVIGLGNSFRKGYWPPSSSK